MSPGLILLMGLAGGLGAAARFLTDGLIKAHARTVLPLGTVTVNLIGSLALGVITALAARGAGDPAGLIAGTGLCGGFTTFSTASVEIVRLLMARRAVAGLGALALNALGCVAAAWLGYAAAV